jgi:hypothetical protein
MFNKTITENFPNLRKLLPMQVQDASSKTNRLDQNSTSPWYIIIKTTSIENRERISKSVREKKQITYEGKPIKITDFPMETLKARRAWREVFQALNENNFNPRTLYPAKLSFKIEFRNEESGYPVPNLNKIMLNVTKELSEAHQKKNLKEEISKKFMEKILGMVNQNV